MRHLALAAALLLASSAAVAALSPEDIERLKSAASATAAIAQNKGVMTQDGKVSVDSSGKTAAAPSNSVNTSNQLSYVKGLYGVQSVASDSNPAAGGGAGGGAAGGGATGQLSVDFQCGRDEGSRKVAGGVSVALDSCYGTSMAAVEALKLSFCTATLSGTPCTPDKFTVPAIVRAGAYSDVAEGLSAGFACNSAGACRVTARTSFSVHATGDSLRSQAQASSANNGTIVNNLRDNADKIAKSDLYETVGKSMSDCVQSVDDATTGKSSLTTCAKDKAVAAPEVSADGSKCETKWVCDQQGTQSATFTRTCDRTFPVTGYSCNWTVPTFECTVTQSGTADASKSCTNGMVPGDGELVSSSAKTCAASDASGGCATSTWTEYYAAPKKMTQSGSCQSQPLAVQGSPTTACAMGGKGTFSSCESGGWYRRTLSETECTSSSVDAQGAEVLLSLTEHEKPGCGVCVLPVTQDVCRGVPTAAQPADSCSPITSDPACGAAPTSVTAETTLPSTLPGGFATSQHEVYTCQVSQTSCVSRHQESNCPVTGLTKGLDTQSQEVPLNQASMNQALAGAALVDAVGQAAEECRGTQEQQPASSTGAKSQSSNSTSATTVGAPCASTQDLRIFNGKDMRCRHPVGYFAGYTDNDCCQITLQRPGGDNLYNKCTLPEAELASARRANLTQFIGEFCSKKSGMGPFKHCTQMTQTYCSFPGILAKVIQQQGRVQLAEAVSSGLSTPDHATLAYDFYSAAQGKWTPAVAANGVLVSAWQTARACSKAGGSADCPSTLTQWFATCDPTRGGCSDLPLTPEAGSDSWAISPVDPLSPVAHAISSRTTVTGGCDTATSHCAYEVSVVPVGSAGRVSVQRALNFPVALRHSDPNAYPVFLGSTVIKPIVEATPGEGPRTLSISTDSGVSWSLATVPFQISGSQALGGTGATISGGCTTLSNVCQYTISGTVQISAKPWGGPQSPDCSGFTTDQLSALDFSRMDLSEWIASVMGKLGVPDASSLVGQASTEGQRYFDVYQKGGSVPQQRASHPTAANTAIVSPRQGWAPFKASVVISANYPENFDDPALNTDPVFGATVDWGDCTSTEQATIVDQMINGYRASGFAAEHVYLPPDKIACADRGPRNITHTVKIIINSKSGTHETSAQVLNIWTGHRDTVGVDEGQGGKSAY